MQEESVFLFSLFLSPPPPAPRAGEAAAAARKSSGKPLMDNYATAPRPQHLAPLSFLLQKNNNKQVVDPAVRFCHSFLIVGAADAEKFPFFRMHI